jgi:hypothetical protein
MDELLNKVTEKTGLSPDQAKAAVDAVLGFLKERLPAPFASALDSLAGAGGTSGETGGEELASAATAALGNLFHKSS